jgi:hypothetical protein
MGFIVFFRSPHVDDRISFLFFHHPYGFLLGDAAERHLFRIECGTAAEADQKQDTDE